MLQRLRQNYSIEAERREVVLNTLLMQLKYKG